MKAATFIGCILSLVNFCFFCTHGVLTQKPEKDVFGLLNGIVELNCRTNLTEPVNWEYEPYGTTIDKWIYLNGLMTKAQETRYKVESRDRNYRLIIESVDWYYAGRYRCTDGAGLGESAIAQLTVIDPRPRCSLDDSSCFQGAMSCAFYYLGDAVPTFNLTKHIYGQNATDAERALTPPKQVKLFNISFDPPCEKADQRVDITNNTKNDTCNACILYMSFATDEKSLVSNKAGVTTVYKITLNHTTKIGLLSFTSPIPTKIHYHHVPTERDMTSGASCALNDTTIALSVLVSITAVVVVVLSVYIVYLKRIITSLRCGSDGATSAPPVSGNSAPESHRYEMVEGDFDDSLQSATGEVTYDLLGQRVPYKPSVYDRLKGPRKSTQISKQGANNYKEEGHVASGASWDPCSSREETREKPQFEESYMTLIE